MKLHYFLLWLFPIITFSQAQPETKDCYLPADNSNFVKNWEALCDCKKSGKPIMLNQVYYVTATTPFFDNNDLIIKGTGKETSGIVFLNPIKYFESDHGVNMSFENVSLTTGNYNKFKNDSYLTKTRFSDFYRLQDISAAEKTIDIDYIKIKNCFIGGSIQILLGGNQKDYAVTNGVPSPAIQDYHIEKRSTGVDAVIIEDNIVEYPYVLASVSAFPKETSIRRNIIYNLRQAFVKVGYANNVYLDDNHVKNDFIAEPGMTNSSGYISLLVALGANKLEGHRNSFINVLSRGGCEVCFIFPSVRNLIWDSNKSLNSFGICPGAEINLMKLKQCENYTLTNNDLTINREGYFKLGLLSSLAAPIESVSPKYYTSFLSPSNDYNPGFKAVIKNNLFEIPSINRASLLMSDDNVIIDNTFIVEYFASISAPLATSVYNQPDLLFMIEGGNRGYLKFNSNDLYIGKSYNSAFGVIGFKKAPHKAIENCNNSYYVDEPCKVNFGGPIGHITTTYKATDNFISKGSVEDVSAITFDNYGYPYTELCNVSYTTGTSIGKTAETHIANLESFGKTEVEVLQNSSDTFGLFRFLASDFVFKTTNKYFDGTKNVAISIKIVVLNADGIEETLYYKVPVNNRSTLLYSGAKWPITSKQLFAREVTNAENKPSQIKLVHKNFRINDASYLQFEGLSGYKIFTVSVSVQKTNQP